VRAGPAGIAQLPTTSERLVKGHHRVELVSLCLSEGDLRWVKLLFGVQHIQITGAAAPVPKQRKLNRLLERRYLLLPSHPLPDQLGFCDERVRYLAERLDDRGLILRDGLVPEGLLVLVLLEKPAALEDRPARTADDVPNAKSLLECVSDRAGFTTVERSQAERRKEVCDCDTDLRICFRSCRLHHRRAQSGRTSERSLRLRHRSPHLR